MLFDDVFDEEDLEVGVGDLDEEVSVLEGKLDQGHSNFSKARKKNKKDLFIRSLQTNVSGINIFNPRCACARVTVVRLCVCVSDLRNEQSG